MTTNDNTRPTNGTSLTSRCWALSREIRLEAENWTSNPARRRELLRASGALAFAGREAIKNPDLSADALDANTEVLREALRDRLGVPGGPVRPIDPIGADVAQFQSIIDDEFARIIATINMPNTPSPRPGVFRRIYLAIFGEWSE